MRFCKKIVAVSLPLFFLFLSSISALELASDFDAGTILLKENRLDESIKIFSQALQADAKSPGLRFNLGCALALKGDYEQAIAAFEEFLTLGDTPHQAFADFNLGSIYAKKFFLSKNASYAKKAAGYFQKASECLPGFILAVDRARVVNFWLGSLKEMRPTKRYQFLTEEIIGFSDSEMFLGEDKFSGEGADRVAIFDQDTPPEIFFYQGPAVYMARGQAACQQKRSDEALICFQAAISAIDLNAKDRFSDLIRWNAYLALGRIYQEQKKWDRVIEYANKVKELNLNNHEALLMEFVASLKKRDYRKAKLVADFILEKTSDKRLINFAKRLEDLQIDNAGLTKDGFYEIEDHKIKIKSPPGWFICNKKINSKEFDANSPENGKSGIVCIFLSGLFYDDPMVSLSLRSFEEDVPLEEFADFMVTNVKEMSRHNSLVVVEEPPSIIRLGDKQFVRYAAQMAGSAQKTKIIYYYLIKDKQLCTLCFNLPQEDFPAQRRMIEETVSSITFQ